MDYTQKPAIVLLNTEDLHRDFVNEVKSIVPDEKDVEELFNQAIDFITDTVSPESFRNYNPHLGMLRATGLKNDTALTSNGMTIYHKFNMLCGELIKTLIELRTAAIIDPITGNELYPYYFLKLKNGNVLLKRL